MKKFTFALFLTAFSIHSRATTWIVIAGNNDIFLPANLSIAFGDTVFFNITIDHDALEVSKATYDANGTTPLPGGFAVSSGGGTVFPNKLQVGTHYYVCTSHIDHAMKAIISVTTAGVPNISGAPVNVKVFPNPVVDKLNVQYHLEHRGLVQINITDLLGKVVAVLRNETDMPGDYAHTYDELALISGSRYFLDINIDGNRTVQKLAVQ